MATSAPALLAILGFALCGFLGSRTGFEYVTRVSSSVQWAGSIAEHPKEDQAKHAIPKGTMPSMRPSNADSKDSMEAPSPVAADHANATLGVMETADARALGATWEPFVEKTKVVGPSRDWWQPAEFVVVVAGQRSGSSNLTLELSRHHLCLYGCNEFFGGTAAIPCTHAVKGYDLTKRRAAPLKTIKKVRNHLCSTRMPHSYQNTNVPKNVRKQCSKGCVTAFKLFTEHGVHGEKLLEMMKYGGTRVVVLERNPAKRWCSLNWAEKTGDWGTDPSKHKYKRLGKRPPCPAHAPADYLKTHQDWYGEVRGWLTRNSIPRLEVNFDAYMENGEAVLKKIQKFAGL